MKAASARRVKRPRRAIAAALTVAFVAAAVQPAAGRPVDPPTPTERVPTWVRVGLPARSAAEAKRLARALPEWEEAIAAGSGELLLPPDRVADLRAAGHDLEVLGSAPASTQSWPGCYRTLDEAYRWVDEYAGRHTWLVEVLDIGDSYCKTAGGCTTPGGDRIAGRDLLVARVTNGLSVAPKGGTLFIDGGLHAREIPGPEVVADFMTYLVDGYGVDPQITYLLDHRELYIGLNSNPDGRELVEMGTRPPYDGEAWSWRKNGHDAPLAACAWPPEGANHFGVDLNRNHGFKWSAPGHTTDPCGVTYRGAAPASEPEIVAYERFVRSLFDDRRGAGDDDAAPLDTSGMLVNFHNATMPGTVLMPWGWTDDPAPNAADLEAIARRYADLAGSYRVRTALYAVSGNTRDWAYGDLGIPAYVVELEGRTFFTPCDDLADLVRSQRPPLLMALGIADRPYERSRGPEVAEVEVAARVVAGEPIAIRAKADATAAIGGAVGAVEVTFGRPGGSVSGSAVPSPAEDPGVGLALAADDGAFGEAAEWAVGDVPSGRLGLGTHYVVVRAADARGHWGPARAAFLEIVAPTATPSPSATFTATATASPSATATSTATDTPPATATASPTPTATSSPTPRPQKTVWLPRLAR